jgi:hypothetical protein
VTFWILPRDGLEGAPFSPVFGEMWETRTSICFAHRAADLRYRAEFSAREVVTVPSPRRKRIPAVFSATKNELKELKALKAYWGGVGRTTPVRSRASPAAGRRKRPTGERSVYKSIVKDPLRWPWAEEATKCYVEDRVMRFRSTLLHTCIETAAAV